jgi:ribosomal protein L32
LVKRVYLEANGSFSILRNPDPLPGLSVLPDWDKEFADTQKKDPTTQACKICGNTTADRTHSLCNNCGNNEWVPAINTK